MIKKILFFIVALALSAMAEERANFLFVLVDDLGCRDLGVEGSSFASRSALRSAAVRCPAGKSPCRADAKS